MSDRNRALILAASCGVFLALGALMAAVGPILPSLSERLGESLTVLGSIFTAIFLGTLIAQLITGSWGDRYGMAVVLFGGSVLLAAGFLGVTVSPSLPWTLGLGFLGGLGVGAVDLAANMLVAQIYPTQSVSKVNLVNMFYGAGAFIGPALIGLSLLLATSAVLPIWGMGLFVIAMLPVLYWIATAPRFRMQAAGASKNQSQREFIGILHIGNFPLLIVLGLLLLIYVGMEVGLGGWVTAYMMETTALAIETAAMIASAFWVAITVGRIVGIAVGSRLSPIRFLSICLAGAVAGSLVLVAALGNFPLTVAAVMLVGLCFGPIFPTVLAILAISFSRAPGKAGGLATAMGSAGGAMIPWLQGVLLTKVSPLACILCTAVCVMISAGLVALAGWLMQRQQEQERTGMPASG